MEKSSIKKILITGAKGMLGHDLIDKLKDYEIIATDIDELDVTKESAISQIKDSNPDIIVHLAAYTDVDGCEDNISQAFEVNALGTRNVAIASKELDIPMIYISTDYVFDGKKDSPYFEFDTPNPLNIYGKSKLAGEWFTQNLSPFPIIVRTSWLYDKYGKNFVYTILNLAKRNNTLKIVDDQIGSPTYTKDLAEALKLIIGSPQPGIYHVTNSGFCSWYEFAKEILSLKTINVNVIPIKSEELKRPATRPKNSKLHNFIFYKTYGIHLPNWRSALKSFLQEID